MDRLILAIFLTVTLAVSAAAGPHKDAAESAEKAYHDCIINKHQKKVQNLDRDLDSLGSQN